MCQLNEKPLNTLKTINDSNSSFNYDYYLFYSTKNHSPLFAIK